MRGDRHMWGILATDPRMKSRLFGALALVGGPWPCRLLATSTMRFSAIRPTMAVAAGGSSDQFPPGSSGARRNVPGTLPAAAAARRRGSAPVIAITPVTIEPGSNTGTAVSATIATLRGQIATLEEHLAANAAHLTELRNQGADAAQRLPGRQSAHHHAPAGRHDARQSRTRQRMERGAKRRSTRSPATSTA